MSFDILTIGDYSLDVILEIPADNSHYRIDKTAGTINLRREDKILAKSLNLSIGGNACNVAVGLSRLGIKTSYMTFIGDDFSSDMLRKEMEAESVDLSYSVRGAGMRGNYSTTLFLENEKTIIVYNHPNIYRLPQDLPRDKMVYVSSLGPDYLEFLKELVLYCQKQNIVLAFNPASHQFQDGLEKYSFIFSDTDYLFVNKYEANKMLNTEEPDIKILFNSLLKLGAKCVVITDGENGAYASDGINSYFCQTYKLPVVQKTGAGDAFASGFLAAVHQGKTIRDGLVYGSINAASVIAGVGPHQGLLHKNELTEFLTKSPPSVVEL